MSTIHVNVRLFAMLKEFAGTSQLALDLPEGSTVADLVAHLTANYPPLAPYLQRMIIAVNHNYGSKKQVLAPGDEVAIFPPVSGGSGARPSADEPGWTHVAITPDPIDAAGLIQLVTEPGAGAVVVFAGTVRDHNLGRPVTHLEYEAYPEMAADRLRQVVKEARERWPAIRRVAVVHRIGRMELAEAAVLIAVGAPHRDDGAFEATRYAIDRIKEIVPVWKREGWAEGETWLEGEYHPKPGE
jgi:molybdopterin synthase catalytic subunit